MTTTTEATPDTEEDVWARLAAPFGAAQIGKKPLGKGNGGNRVSCRECGGYHAPGMSHGDFVNHAIITHRLNSVVGPGMWGYDIHRIVENGGHVQAVIGQMTILDRTIGIETGEPERQSTYGDELKAAISDFIRRAAMRFGIGLDLWARQELERTPEAPAAEPTGSTTTATRTREQVAESRTSAPKGSAQSPFGKVCDNLGMSPIAALKALRHGKSTGAEGFPPGLPMLASLAAADALEPALVEHAAAYLRKVRDAA